MKPDTRACSESRCRAGNGLLEGAARRKAQPYQAVWRAFATPQIPSRDRLMVGKDSPNRPQKPQPTAGFRWQHLMNAHYFACEPNHLVGESATHPMGQRCGALAALLRLAGTIPRGGRALPERHSAAPSGASDCGFQVHADEAMDLSPRPSGSGKWTVSWMPGRLRTLTTPRARKRSITC